MKKLYKMANKIIQVSSIYGKVHDYCRNYVYNGELPPDFCVETSQQDIDLERETSKKTKPQYIYSDEYLEELAVYRKIAENMINYDTFLFHGSVIAVNGVAYAFTAKSGTGKSTHARLWREYLGERAIMINDDKPLLKITDSNVIAFGTPYNGKHSLSTNTSAPIKSICILERSENNFVVPLDDEYEAFACILEQTYLPDDPKLASKTLSLVEKTVELTDIFQLGCNMDIEAAKIAYNAIK